jgi:hypothetical protein
MKIRQAGNSHSLVKSTLLFAAGLILALAACHDPAKKDDKAQPRQVNLIELLIGSGDHTFRKVSLGDDPKTVKAAEQKIPDETDTNYISYSLPMDTLHADSVNGDIDSLNYFTIAYNFDHQKLNEIDEDVFLATDSAGGLLAKRLTAYFSNKYGEPAQESDSMVWSYTKSGKKISISLSDQSEEYDYGKLSLVFYCESY